jgi:hypothetical protein
MDGKRRIQKRKISSEECGAYSVPVTMLLKLEVGRGGGALREQNVILLSPSPFKLIPLDSYFFFFILAISPS